MRKSPPRAVGWVVHRGCIVYVAKKQKIFGGNLKAAKLVGEMLAKRAKDKGIKEVIFDLREFNKNTDEYNKGLVEKLYDI